ncbi:sugar-binding protein [Maribacter sp. CXY002]|uniref:sugar-binding protein n=1 Tax=Maribacter luteocoastalis TaxID=3407671 RepID=UPI003B674D01
MKKWLISKITDFENWDCIAALDDFSYPWLNEVSPKTEFRGYYDTNFFHFHFTAYGSVPKVYVETNDKLEVRFSERVELFFRGNDKMQPYYCLEMDPRGRVLDYKANMYRKFDRSWTWPDSLGIKIKCDREKYTLEGRIKLKRLKELGLLSSFEIQIGLYRGQCVSLDRKSESIKWISWVDPKTKNPDFHVPSSFGILRLR